MPEIAKLGHVALVTPDLEKSTWFFRDIVGLEETDRDADAVFLAAWGDFEHHSLSLTAGDEARLDHVGWRTARPEHVDEFAERLEEGGIGVTRVEAGEERGQGRAIRFALAGDGHPLELYYDVDKPAAAQDRRSRLKNNAYRPYDHGVSPRRIDHVNLWTADPTPSRDWLELALGFKNREAAVMGGNLVGAWMSVTSLPHDVAVMADPGGQSNRFHHVAYHLDNWHDVLRGIDILSENGIAIDLGPGRHGVSQAFFSYVKDPGSGHRIELFSGGFHIFDPDWETVVWEDEDMKEGLIWWGADYLPGQGSPLDTTTPAGSQPVVTPT